jgi:hypothetical protein
MAAYFPIVNEHIAKRNKKVRPADVNSRYTPESHAGLAFVAP